MDLMEILKKMKVKLYWLAPLAFPVLWAADKVGHLFGFELGVH